MTGALRLPLCALPFLAASFQSAFAQPVVPLGDYRTDKVSTGLVGLTVGSGARALGMGGAFIAVADDGTAASWNPSGLCVLERPEASVVFEPSARTSYSFPATQGATYLGERHTESAHAALDFVSAAYPIRLGGVKWVPQISYQRAIDQSNTTKTPPFPTVDTYKGPNFVVAASEEGRHKGGLDVYTASLGVSLGARVYLGASFNMWRNGTQGELVDVSYWDSLGLKTSQRQGYLDTESFAGRNWTFGALFKPSRRARLGLVFKTPFTMSYEHSIELGGFSAYDETGALLASYDYSSIGRNETGRLRWPLAVGAGIAVLPIEALTLSADYTRTRWSRALVHYDASADREAFEVHWPNAGGALDTEQIRLGAEYIFRVRRLRLDAVAVRGGVFRDQQYFGYRGGGERFHAVSAGAGLMWPRIGLDVAYVQEFGAYEALPRPYANGATRYQSRQLIASVIARF